MCMGFANQKPQMGWIDLIKKKEKRKERRRRRAMEKGRRRRLNYLLPPEDLEKFQMHTCVQSEGIELETPQRWKPKVEQPTYIRKNRFQSKNSKRRQ